MLKRSKVSNVCIGLVAASVLTGALAVSPAHAGFNFITVDGPAPNDGGSRLSGINNAGVVVGTGFDADFNEHGFIGTPDALVSFAVPDASGSLQFQTILGGINDNDVVVGFTPVGPGQPGNPLVEFHDGNVITLPAPPDDFGNTIARSVNNAGVIAGTFNDLVNHKPRGFVRDATGNYTRFDVNPTTEFTSVAGISNNGTIIGNYSILHAITAAFERAADGTITLLDTPTSIGGIPISLINYNGINASGVTVGSFLDGTINSYGFLRDAAGNFTLVQDPDNPSPSGVLGINDNGDLVGIYLDLATGLTHGYVATPAPGRAGDMNCDGAVDFGDINPFVTALTSRAAFQAQHPACAWITGDINGDGTVDFGDINPFVALLTQ